MSEEKLSNEFVRNVYNNFLSKYDNTYSHHRWFRSKDLLYQHRQSTIALEYCLKNLNFNKALEIGGGDGEWTKILSKHVAEIDFLDISEEMLKMAKTNLADNSNINFLLADFLDNQLKDNDYDVILSFRSFEYFFDKDKFFKEINRVLKNGGSMIIVTKSPLYDWSGYYKTKVLHSGQLRIADLLRMFQKYGFEVEIVKPAIVGKKLKFSFMRLIFNIFYRLNYLTKFNILPLFILQYISESFIIRVKKV